MTFYYDIHNPADVRELSEQMAMWQATDNPKQYEWKEQPTQPSPDAQWVGGQWIIPAPRTYSAGEWLDHVGFGSNQQPTLIYLKLQLQAAGKSSAKLEATEQYLNQMLAIFATDPQPRCDWENPPYPFNEVVADVMYILHL